VTVIQRSPNIQRIMANLLYTAFLLFITYQSDAYKYPFQDPTMSWESRVEDLLGRLTLEEIANQTLALYETSENNAVPRLGINPYVWITECVRGQVNTNTTAFPHSLGLAASFRYILIRRQSVYFNFIFIYNYYKNE
jgi:beta-glucosidase